MRSALRYPISNPYAGEFERRRSASQRGVWGRNPQIRVLPPLGKSPPTNTYRFPISLLQAIRHGAELIMKVLGNGEPARNHTLARWQTLAVCHDSSFIRVAIDRLSDRTIPHRHHWIDPKPIDHSRCIMGKVLAFDRIGHQHIQSNC